MADPQSFNSGIDWTTKSGLQNPETLNDAIENASFCVGSAALDQTTIEDDGSGKAQVKDGGITVPKLASDLTGISAKIPPGELTLANMGFDIPGVPGPGGHYINALYQIDVPAPGSYFGFNYVNLEVTKAVAAGDVVQVVASILIKSVLLAGKGEWRRAAAYGAVEVNGLSKGRNSDQPALFDVVDGGESAEVKSCFHLWTFNESGTAKIRVQQSNELRLGKVGWMALGVLHFPATTR